MKKVLSVFLSLCMLVSVVAGFGIDAYALDNSGSCGANLTYTFDSVSGKLTISGTGKMTDYDSSNASPFISPLRIKSIVIESGVTSIGDNAFVGDVRVESVTIPNTVTSIGANAFRGCVKLASVSLPTHLVTLKDDAFSGCTSLTSVVVPDTVLSLGESVFSGCTGLLGVTLSKNLTVISAGLLEGCIKLSSISIPSPVITISDGAFRGCTALTSITLPDNVISIGNNAISGCTSLTTVNFGRNVNIIGDYAFSGCTSLASVVLPNSVIKIGNSAFYLCSKLASATVTNPKCEIYESENTFPETTTLIGLANGNIISYAKNYNRTYNAVTCDVLGLEHGEPVENTVTHSVNYITDTECSDTCSDVIKACSNCAEEYEHTHEVINIAEHTVATKNENVVAATCARAGSYQRVTYCTRCNKEFSRTTVAIAKRAHTYGAWVVTTNPTCARAGVQTSTCTKCSAKRTAAVKATGKHSYTNAVTKAPTSSANGVLTYTCKVCKGKVTKAIPKLVNANISKLTAQKKGFKATWAKVSSANGYQIRYSTKSNMSSAKSVNIAGNGTVAKTITSLSANKKYYVQIRTYRTINGKNYYSSWSKAKAVTTKK